MRGVWVHGGLLLVMTALALSTSTSERYIREDAAWSSFWQRDSADVVSVTYRSDRGELTLSRRNEDGESFVWGSEVGRDPESEELSFPVGIPGAELVDALGDLKVPRILGTISPGRVGEFGFADLTGTMTVNFVDGTRTVEVGGAVHGTEDRYARDAESGSAFVLPGAIIEPLSLGSEAVRERRLHHFLPSDVARVHLRSRGSERQMLRGPTDPGVPSVWLHTDGSGQRDQTFANFMGRVEQLAIETFRNPVVPETLDVILFIEYYDADEEVVGFMELSRLATDGTYFIRTERTRIPAQAYSQASSTVEQDLRAIF